MDKKTLIIGASDKPERYAFKALKMLQEHDVKAVPFGIRKGSALGVDFLTEFPTTQDFHTVTMYINPERQQQYYQAILDLKPQRVIFNPGTENEPFETQLREAGIEAEEACTLVLLSTHQY